MFTRRNCNECNGFTFWRDSCGSCPSRLVKEKTQLADEKTRLAYEKTQLANAKTQLTNELRQLKTTSEYRDTEHKEFRAFLSLQFESEQAKGNSNHADVAIVVQDKKDKPLYAHKIVLASRSPVFSKMFKTEMLESETGVLQINDGTLPVIHAVIGFCYHAEIEFTAEVTAEDVLAVAHKYAIHFLQKLCEEHLSKTINKVNLPARLKLAKKYEATRLQKEALEYLKNHFDEVVVGVVDDLF
ncbi:unnamed protein product [Calypogeia fissa]